LNLLHDDFLRGKILKIDFPLDAAVPSGIL
jgi:hypothetical protein